MTYVYIFFIGFFCSILGSAGWGSALISIPLLTLLGITPNQAIATAKVWALGTLLSGLYSFARAGKVDTKIGIVCALLWLLGSFVGGYILIHIDAKLLEWIFGICTLVIIVLMLVKSKLYKIRISFPKWLRPWKYLLGYSAFFLVGMWWGLLAGQAVIATLVLVELFWKTFTEASWTRKLTWLAIAVGALGMYIFGDVINWTYGLIMLAGTLLGGYIGSEFALMKWEKFIEIVFYCVAIVLSIKGIVNLFT